MSSVTSTDTPLGSDSNGYYIEINNGIHKIPFMDWTSTNPISLFMVFYSGQSTCIVPLSVWRPLNGNASSILIQIDTDTQDGIIYAQYGNNRVQPNGLSNGIGPKIRKNNALLSFICDVSGTTNSLYINGLFTKSETNPNQGFGGVQTVDGYIGHDGGSWRSSGQLKMREILIYKGTLTTEQREKIEGYLSWKWKLQSNLPSNHLWYSSNPATTGNVAPINTYRINHINPQQMQDVDTTLMAATVPLIQAGGFVHDSVKNEGTTINDIFNKHVGKEVGVQSLRQKRVPNALRKTHKK